MLINLSNHPSSHWSPEQMTAALKEFGAVQNIQFPSIDPSASLKFVNEAVDKSVELCLSLLPQADTAASGIHIMGEYSFVFLFVSEMQRRGIRCVASTSERLTVTNIDGSKTTRFKFVQFRDFFIIQ